MIIIRRYIIKSIETDKRIRREERNESQRMNELYESIKIDLLIRKIMGIEG